MRALHGVLPAALLVLLAAAGGAVAQDQAPDEDPFEDEPGLFEGEEDDPFAELEQRASLGEDEDGTEAQDADEEHDEAEDADRIPAPFGAALVGLALAAGTLDRLRSRA